MAGGFNGMAFLFANNVNTTLATAATSTQTTLSLTSTVGIPTSIPSNDYFALTLNDAATRSVFEVVYVTAVSGSNVTVLRGQEGTTANAWLAGDFIYGALTAGEISQFAFVSGNSAQPFAVAPASASAPQNAPQFGQMFDLQQPTANGSITLSALHTIVIPSTTAPIILTILPGTNAGQECKITGTSYGVTVQSSVQSGTPAFTFPDGTNAYSFTLLSYGAQLFLVWDGQNWRVQTIGQTVVATTTANNQAPPLSQIQAQFAAINGNTNQNFSAATITASAANFTGNVTAANATVADQTVVLGQFTSPQKTVGGPVVIGRPDGLIFQFGSGIVTASGTGNYTTTVDLPQPFPNAGLFAIGNWGGTAPPGGGSAFPFTTPSKTQVTLGIYAPGAGDFVVAYMAVGY